MKFAYERPDGQVSILVPVEDRLPDETDADYMARIRSRAEECDPSLKSFVFRGLVDSAHLNRKFRQAWRIKDGKLEEDQTEVVKIKWGDVRNARDALLSASDIKRKISEDSQDGKSNDWKKYQQALRDITKQADPDKVVWPEPPK